MKHLKIFEDFSKGNDVVMVKLIDDNGVVIDKNGIAVEGVGISSDGKEYMAGVSADGTIYVGIATEQGALNSKNVLFDIQAGTKYDGRESFQIINNYHEGIQRT